MRHTTAAYDPFIVWLTDHETPPTMRDAWQAALKLAIQELCPQCRVATFPVGGRHEGTETGDRRCPAEKLHIIRELSAAR